MKTLYAHQKRFLKRNPDRAMLVWSVGTGKTRSACEWGKMRSDPALIICPKGLKENWRRECELWGLKGATIISKEEFKKLARKLDFKVVIVDEADHFFSALFKSQLSKALRRYVEEKKPHLLLCTGTPHRSSPWNIYSAATLLGHKWNFREFQFQFFTQVQMGFRLVPVIRSGTEDELKALIASISDVVRAEDEFDIPPQIDEIIYCGETKEQERAHRENVEIAPIVRFTRDHQIEAGIAIKDDNKLERVLQYALDASKIAVVCRYREQLDTYAWALRDRGHIVYEIHGGIDDRSAVLDKVEQAEKCVLLIQSATCEGWEAPSIGLMVFASMDYSYRNHTQVRGRILRMNRLKKNIYVHLIAGDTDKAILAAMTQKRDMDVLAFERERKGTGNNRKNT